MNKIENIRNKFKVVRDLLVSLAAGMVVVMAFSGLSGKPNTNNQWKDHNDGRFMIKHTDMSGKVSYSDVTGYNIIVDKTTGVNYICSENGACSPLYSMVGNVVVDFKDVDWRRKD